MEKKGPPPPAPPSRANSRLSLVTTPSELDPFCREWVAKMLPDQRINPETPFSALFKDGVLLCRVINQISPGTIKQIHNSNLPFKHMENIENYLKGCTSLGLSDTQLFNTIDLYEEKDLNRVKRNIFNLSKVVADGKSSAASAVPSSAVGHAPSPVPIARKGAAPPVPHRGLRPKAKPAPPNPALKPNPRDLMKNKTRSAADVTSLQDDINMKAAFKYNPILEQQAKSWVEQVLGIQNNTNPFYETFKDGVLLCRLINAIKPGTIPEGSYKESSIAYKQMENISAYTKGCLALGISQFDCFNTVDLFEAKNLNLVINNIHVLAKHVEAQELNPSLPKIENSSRARRAYSIFFTEVAGLRHHLQEGHSEPINWDADPEEEELMSWINSRLEVIPVEEGEQKRKVETWKDLRDGVVIIQLLEYLTDQSVGIYSRHPKMPWHSMQNAALILRFLNEQLLSLFRGCTAHDIFLGNAAPLKVLLKLIREKFDHEFNFRGLKEDTKRQKVVEELVTTERTYVELLSTVVESLVLPLKAATGSSEDALQLEELEEVFANIEDILAFHQGLLATLEERYSRFSADTMVADVLVKKFDEHFVALNKRYVRDFDGTHLVIRYLASKSEPFQQMLEKFEKDQSTKNGLLLNSFLILPVQRVPRYMLLLQELAKYTPDTHPDAPHVKQAVIQTGVILDEINNSKKTSDGQEKLKAVEASIAGLEDLPVESLIHPKRHYIHEGKLDWVGESEGDAYFFLFSDFLMHCTTQSEEEEGGDEDAKTNEKGFHYVTIVPIRFFQKVADSPNNPTAFDATFDEEVGTFVAPTEEEKKEWMKQINRCMEEKITIEFDL